MSRTRVHFLTMFLVLAAFLATGAASALAQQQATPQAGNEPPHPVHIHSGSCDALGDVVYPLNDIQLYNVSRSFSISPAATPEPGAAGMGTPLPGMSAETISPVQYSITHVDANLIDLIGGGYAINAHESNENIGNYIACGDIPVCTGITCTAVTSAVLPLAQLNDSGYVGIAQLVADPNGGVNVTVFLIHAPNLPSATS
jgi:hypothetical protein